MRCENCGTQNPPGFKRCIFCKAELEEEVHEEDITYGYLVCSECKGFYELQEGEDPEDYYECECGGKLIFYWYKEEFLE